MAAGPRVEAERRLSNATMTDLAYEALKEQIVNGDLRPGQKISERALASTLGVSRTPLREAALRLLNERLVDRSPTGTLHVSVLDERAVSDIYACRVELECLAARMAIDRAADAEVQSLADLIDAAERAHASGDLTRTIQMNSAFHEAIYRLARNGWLMAVIEPLLGQLLRIRVVVTRLDVRQTFPAEHRSIFEAIRVRDPEAADRAVRAHVRHDLVVVTRHLRSVVTGLASNRAQNEVPAHLVRRR